MAVPQAAARTAFAAELLRAREFPTVAALASQAARQWFGLHSLRIVWFRPGHLEGYRPIRLAPGTSLKPAEQSLTLRALAEAQPVYVDNPDGTRLYASTLVQRGPTGFATMLWTQDAEEKPPTGPLWRSFVDPVAAAARTLLELEVLADAVSRLEKAERLQRALFSIADMASADLEMVEMLSQVHEIIGGLMYAENFFIVLYNQNADTVRFIYFADSKDATVFDPYREIPVSELGNSLTMAMIRSGHSMMGPTLGLRDEYGIERDASFGPDAEDWLGVPMISGARVCGAVVVQSYLPDLRYTEEDRTLLSYVAQHILTALERKQAHEELERRVEQRTKELAEANRELTIEVQERQRSEKLQAALFRIAELASTTESLTEFYASVHEIVGELLYAHNFFIALLTEDDAALEFPYAVDERDPISAFVPRQLSKGLTEYVLRRGQPLLANRATIERLHKQGEVTSFGTRSDCWLGVPLICDDVTVGVLVVQSYSTEHTYTARDQELLTFVSYQIANGLQRKRAQQSLKDAYAELERRVEERTRELAEANRELRDQITVRERMESKLKHEALHDALTGLPNRSYLLDRLARALARYKQDPKHQFATLFLDLDRFKVVNDSVGHLVGDEMLKEASVRLQRCVREPDVVSRLGGDEFAILIEDVATLDAVCQVAQRVIDTMCEPMRIAGKELFTSASVGIALSHERYNSSEELLRDADVAMYRAKAKGRQRYEMFDERLHAEALHLLDLEGDLRRAILRREFEPHFQTIVRLSDGGVVAYEALLRWKHPERGLMLPADFLAIAEESGSAEAIDWQMFEMTCREIPSLVTGDEYVSLNVSARHFRSPDFAGRMIELLNNAGVEGRRVRLEVTEGALLDSPEMIRDTLEELKVAGVATALDDFGTGYSSLSYLHRFPLQALKIDRSFVADLKPGGQGSSAPVIRAICALAGSLSMEVIAEGIETTMQRDALIEIGCTLGQGFLYSHPRPAVYAGHAMAGAA